MCLIWDLNSQLQIDSSSFCMKQTKGVLKWSVLWDNRNCMVQKYDWYRLLGIVLKKVVSNTVSILFRFLVIGSKTWVCFTQITYVGPKSAENKLFVKIYFLAGVTFTLIIFASVMPLTSEQSFFSIKYQRQWLKCAFDGKIVYLWNFIKT